MSDFKSIDLSKFKGDRLFYGDLRLLLTVKSFDLQEIRKRYLSSLQNKSNRRGSVERRESATGGIVSLSITNGKISSSQVVKELLEPRGIASGEGIVALSSEKYAYMITADSIRQIANPWFSYIHTLNFNEDSSRIIIASSGFDALFEYDTRTLEKTWEWFAWEHGLNKASDPKTGKDIFLSRRKEDAASPDHFIIDNPAEQTLPTAMRAAFINSVEYDQHDNGFVLATLFHHGEIIRIEKATGKFTVVLDKLKTPHGGRTYKDHFMATSTGSGEVVEGNRNKQIRYDFSALPGKDPVLGDREWIQNSALADGKFISIDSNRNCIVIFDPAEELIDMIPYDNNWAVQDLIIFDGSQKLIDQIKLI